MFHCIVNVFLLTCLFFQWNAAIAKGQDVSVHFTREDYGYLNETEDSFITLSVEKVGFFGTPFTVIIELLEPTEDVKGDSWTLYFSDETTVAKAYVFVNSDNLPEQDEVIRFRLKTLPTIEITQPSEAYLTIPANDDANGIVSFKTPSPVEIDESPKQNSTLTLTLKRDRGTFGNVSVSYKITGSSQENEETDGDLIPTKGLVEILEGEEEKDFEITVTDDLMPENDEHFEVTLVNTTGGLQIDESSNSLSVVINGNDSPVRFSQSVYRVEEDAVSVDIPVLRGMDKSGENRVGPNTGFVWVQYSVSAGTASAREDYNIQKTGTITFTDKQHEANLEIFIVNDELPEMAENFTIKLLPDSIQGDAIVTEPMECTVVIETNDHANGILSIDFSKAKSNGSNKYFLIDEDETNRYTDISVVRHGGAFSNVTVEWVLTANDSNSQNYATAYVSPTSGILVFEEGQSKQSVDLDVLQDDEPGEEKLLIFRLLPESIQGGAEIESPSDTAVIISDSDDAYGVFNLDDNTSRIDINGEERSLIVQIRRSGGLIGDVDVSYSSYYLLRGADDVKEAMPGILSGSDGEVLFQSDESMREIHINIQSNAFLETDSKFIVKLNAVQLENRKLSVKAKTPRIGVANITIDVKEEFANGEIGFLKDGIIKVKEPTEEEGPVVVPMELHRQGLSGEATVQVSYRGIGENSIDLNRGQDYLQGPPVITFKPGQRYQNISITVLPDDLPELDEVVLVRLDSVEPSNQKLKRSSSEIKVEIMENDSPGGVFSFSNTSQSHYIIQETETENVNVEVVRDKGDLALRMVTYDVVPDGSEQFYGVPETLVFYPGKKSEVIALVPRDDNNPELERNYTLILQPHGEPLSVLSSPTSVNITVLANDHPHGLFIFEDDNMTSRIQRIGESKLDYNMTAHYKVYRSMGSYGDVSVSWKIIPNDTNDVVPSNGVLHFGDGETEEFVIVSSAKDELPESTEEFTILLYNATNGAHIKKNENATLIIKPNDQAIFFEGPSEVQVVEGEDVHLTIHRDGSGADTTSVRYRTKNGDSNTTLAQNLASQQADYQSVNDTVVLFKPGKLDVDIVIPTFDDEVSEDNEMFYVELFDAKNDYVTYGNVRVRVVIQKNDDASGIFSFEERHDVTMQEGKPHSFKIVRAKGAYGDVTLSWKLFNGTSFDHKTLQEHQTNNDESLDEFESEEGRILFEEGDLSKEIILNAKKDFVPEYDEFYTLALTNVIKGEGKLSPNTSELIVQIIVDVNDYPHGLIEFPDVTSPVELAEDGNNGSEVVVEVNRDMGSDGDVEVLWELHSKNSSLPSTCYDLLMHSTLSGEATFIEGKSPTNTQAVQFSPGSFALVRELPEINNQEEFTFTFWIKFGDLVISSNTTVTFPLISKYDEYNSTRFSIVLEARKTNFEKLKFIYESGNISNQAMSFDINPFSSLWHFFVVTFTNKNISVYLDGILQEQKTFDTATSFGVNNPSEYIQLGSGLPNYNDKTIYLMQDIRLYFHFFSSNQVEELYNMPAHRDVTPVSGYLKYSSRVTSSTFTLRSIDDEETESNENLLLVLLDASGGAKINRENGTLPVTVLKSDNANGVFGFSQPCQPQYLTEGQSFICYVNRSRGLDGAVMVEWTATINGSTTEDKDLSPFHGELNFLPGEIEKSFSVSSVIDDIPEIEETHVLTLTKTTPLDGVESSSSFSGASINPDLASVSVFVESNDKPHGVLQFSLPPPPTSEDEGKIPEATNPPVVHVKEEDDHVILMVERARGWFGEVTTEWRTRDGTAISHQEPKDFESSAGTLSFKNGQGYAELSVKLLDDQDSELEKYFFVELSTPTGGATLNNASKVKVVIAPSDDAFGIFQYNQTSVEVAEPESGQTAVSIQVTREGGDLGSAIVYWKIKDNSTTDVIPVEGYVNFTEGQTTNDVIINVLSDDVPEFDEQIQVDIAKVSRGSLGADTTCTITILSNDDPRGVVTFNPRSVAVEESDRNVTLTLIRSGGLAGTIRVNYATLDTNSTDSSAEEVAVPEQDYQQSVDSVLIGNNVSSANISVKLINDDVPETNEVFFVELLSTELVSSGINVPNSPRLGKERDILAEITIVENDSPHGVLELSSTSLRVDENTEEEMDAKFQNESTSLYVLRKLGSFGDVTVGINVIPGSARSKEDYNLISSEVTFLNGESRKPVPIRIIDDFTPEIEEDFTVKLLPDSVTGGAKVGQDRTCVVTIKESDDPYGLMGISVDVDQIDEPSSGRGTPVTFTVTRHNGLRGLVGLKWQVTVEAAATAASGGNGNSSNIAQSNSDIDVYEGVLYFTTNEDKQQFTIKILPDNTPEDDEVVVAKLTNILPGYHGRIDPDHNEARVFIPANDRPYGDVSLQASNYTGYENDGDRTTVSIGVERSGGKYGTLRVIYSTSEVDLISEMQKKHEDLLKKFQKPKILDNIDPTVTIQKVDILTAEDPLLTCAEACLREKACGAFLYHEAFYECKWITQSALDSGYVTYASNDTSSSHHDDKFSLYEKNITQTSILYSSQAKAGVDFQPLLGASLLFYPGQQIAFINVTILPDTEPELDKYFEVKLLKVEMVGFEPKNSEPPQIQSPSKAKITIEENDFPYGLFVLKPQAGSTSQNGQIEVDEKAKLSLEMLVERTGGSVGDVTVDWSVTGGTALRNDDFIGDDATLKFSHGETLKVISLSVVDDAIPEPNETIDIQLSNPTNGAEVDFKHDNMTIIILANDVVGGVIGFSPESGSVIGQEGKTVTLHLERSEPALGLCHVTWHGESINEHDVTKGLNSTQGLVSFESGQTKSHIDINIRPDSVPEAMEQYKIILSQPETFDVPESGSAVINPLSSVAKISIQDSDDPHGIFGFAPSSQRINIKEDNEKLEIYINRQFGSIGRVRVYYEVIPGTLSTINPDIDIAQPDLDFIYNSRDSYVTFDDGVTSLPISMDVINDDIPELIEIFHVNLTRAVLVGSDGSDITPEFPPSIDAEGSLSQIVIDANDGTKGVIGFDPNSTNISTTEGSTVTLHILRDKGTYGEVSVFVFPQNKDAILDLDYISQPTTIVFEDSQQSAYYNITILDDNIPEGNEVFEVLLGNPSAGLELGNLTVATINIISNDDAHGRISFDNDLLMYLEEPENSNTTAGNVQLIVQRNPPEGVFDEVSVRYKVEQLSENGDVIDSSVEDIKPTEGYVVLDDGSNFQILELSVVPDNKAELEQKYLVSLFEPTNGATLDKSRTSTTLIIKENDGPYGDFKVFPANSRNESREIRVREDNDKLLMIDVVREQGVLGFVTIDLHTQRGTAVPLPPSNDFAPALVPFQTFPDSVGMWYHAFRYKEVNYLIYLTSALTAPLTTPIGKSGTVTTLTPGVHSTLYKWEGVYTPVQTIETDGATCATSFQADGVTYVFITNKGVDGRHETFSRLYEMLEGGGLRVLQDIETKGASYVAHFHSTYHYLVVANSMDNNQVSSIDSVVLRFRISTRSLEEVQSLPTRGAAGLTTFSSNGMIYLAIANKYDSQVSLDLPVSSVVYKWDVTSTSFTQPTSVDVTHASDVTHYIVNDQTLLIFSSATMSRSRVNNADSDVIKIYQVLQNDIDGNLIFRSHQTLNVSRSNKIQLLTLPVQTFDALGRMQSSFVKNESVTIMMTSSTDLSRSFVFDFESLLFLPLFDLMPATIVYPHVVTNQFESIALVAVATNDVTSKSALGSVAHAKTPVDYSQFHTSGIFDFFNVHKNNVSSSDVSPRGDYIELNKTLIFEPGQTVHRVGILLLNDDTPEEDEIFQIRLANPHDPRAVISDTESALDVIIEANDDAHGVIGFAQNSIEKTVEETSRDNVFTLNVVRHKSSYGRVSVDWSAEGSINDITPISGRITFENGSSVVGIQITVLADDLPEVEESVRIQLFKPRLIGDISSSQPRLNSSTSSSLILIQSNDSPHGVVRWAPNSLRTVVNEAETLSGASQLVTLELIREQGALGDIEVHFKTVRADNLPLQSQAAAETDYISRDSTLLMRENSTRAAVAINILPDDIPEGIESFHVIIDDVKLIGESKVGGEPGVARDGSEIAEVTIDENDNARGFIQFNVTRNAEGVVEAFELPRVNNSVLLPLSRMVGFVRTVGVEWLARPVTASNKDFFPSSGSVQFVDGSKSGNIKIFITDDEEVEFMESFTVQLIAATGGAKLGGDLTVTVNIFPNDSPSGMFGFTESSQRVKESKSADDPDGVVEFQVKRFQGSKEDVTVLWELEESARGNISPTSGNLFFPAHTRSKSIILRTIPDQKLEGEQTIELKLVAATGGAEISPVAGEAKVIIEADPGAAGIVSLQNHHVYTSEPDKDYDGIISIVAYRRPSVFGQVLVDWQVTPSDQKTFERVRGQAVFQDGSNQTTIYFQLLDDDIPEISKDYSLRIVAATGGAKINSSANSCLITVVASDNPHGVFTFSQPVYNVQESAADGNAQISSSDSSSFASLTILRNDGTVGEVAVTIQTISDSALPNVDYYAKKKRLIFTGGETSKLVEIEIIDDNLPEGPKDFFVNITDIELLSHQDNDYFPKNPYNLSRDSPPAFGDVISAVVRIAKSDGAEGSVEFDSDSGSLTVAEDIGEVQAPLIRKQGDYGSISVTVNSLNRTASRNIDFLLPSTGIVIPFENGQNVAYVNIPLIDDDLMEKEEKFTLALTSVSGGARIGERKFLDIIILKSDYPNGVIQFVGDSHLAIANPPSGDGATRLEFTLERFGGNQLPATVKWRIERSPPYIHPTTSASSLSEDVASPLSGEFFFDDGEGGKRNISVEILPAISSEEVEENFIIVIEDASPAEVSKEKGNVTITVMKKGNPNGVVKFASSTDPSIQDNQEILEPKAGVTQLVFPITRVLGSLGPINVTWSISAINQVIGAGTKDFAETNGSVLIHDGQINAEIIVGVIADESPELDETFQLALTSVDGGAEIDQQSSIKQFLIRANDDPHGVFSVSTKDQKIVIASDLTRLIRVNITRGQGSFGRVVVGFSVRFDNPMQGISYLTTNTGAALFGSAVTWKTEDIEISSVFLTVGDTFTVQLTTVEYIGKEMAIEPLISIHHSTATVEVVPEVGNPQIGFASPVAHAHVDSNNQHVCTFNVTRNGLYGDVTAYWSSGYASRHLPLGVSEGSILPESNVINMRHQQKSITFNVTLQLNADLNPAYAVHLTRVHSIGGGGAELQSNRDVAEIDPSGAIKFAAYSQNVFVERNSEKLSLTVERLYGSRDEIDISFDLLPVTALPNSHYLPLETNKVHMKSGERVANITVQLVQTQPERSKSFLVNLTSAIQPQNIYQGLSPRIIRNKSISHVTISESRDARGVLGFTDVTAYTKESSEDGSDALVVMVDVQRTVGAIGDASVLATTVEGGQAWKDFIKTLPSGDVDEQIMRHKVEERLNNDETARAIPKFDYEYRQVNVSFPEGTNIVSVPIIILNDQWAEPEEAFFVYLHSPTGGAKVSPERGLIKIIIEPNDVPNGVIGFSQQHYFIDEDSPETSATINVTRTHAYGDVTFTWRALASLNTAITSPTTSGITSTPSVYPNKEIILEEELEATSGSVTCQQNHLTCEITLRLKQDSMAEFAESFYLQLYSVTAGAKIDEAHRVANVTIKDSDSPFGLFQFAKFSRLPVATKGSKSVGLTIERVGGLSTQASVRYKTKQLRRVVTVADATLYPAIANVDYITKEDKVLFNSGEEEAFLTIQLLPESSSANPLPQIFQVVLDWSSGRSELSDNYRVANITIVQDNSVKRIWAVYEGLQQELDDTVIQKTISQLHEIADGNVKDDEIAIFRGCLNTVLKEGRTRRFSDAVLKQIYNLFCKLLNPDRRDAVRSFSDFSESFDQFALCMTSQTECVTTDVTAVVLSNCPHAMVQSAKWYPELINGYVFAGSGNDYFKIPTDLLDTNLHGVGSSNPKCYDIHFIEYSSSIWFESDDEKGPMSDKIFSVGIDKEVISSLKTPVRYRVYTKDARISPQGAECVLWNEASSRWLSTARGTCHLITEGSNFVECGCNHMSVYAARGPTDNLASYNEATYAACFITTVACVLVLLSHPCRGRYKVATRLLMHMVFACAAAHLVFVIDALASHSATDNACSTLAILLHYFWLAQFTWMFVQSINLLQTLSFSNERTDRLFMIYFILGWGLPAIVILLFIIVTYALGAESLTEMYGDVHANREMCMVMTSYGALLGALAPACICILVTVTIAFHLYQRKSVWKKYDDVFYGRYNSSEIPLLFWLFFMNSLTWLWGGLHLAYGYLWMLVLFIVCNFLLGFYILITYGIIHCPLLNRSKDLYNGGLSNANDGIGNENGYHTTVIGGASSVSGDVLNKSTQSLMKMDGVWDPNDNSVNIAADFDEDDLKEDSADFDELIYALKTGNEKLDNNPLTEATARINDFENVTSQRIPSLSDTFEQGDDRPIKTASGRPLPAFPIADTHL